VLMFTYVYRDADLLPHFVDHYAARGCRVVAIVNLNTAPPGLREKVEAVLASRPAEFQVLAWEDVPYDVRTATDVRLEAHRRRLVPEGGWWAKADVDELVELPAGHASFPALAGAADASGANCVHGYWVDRVAAGGEMPAVLPGVPLDWQFPLGGDVTRRLCPRVNHRKLVLFKAVPGMTMIGGCHGCPGVEQRLRGVDLRVHHFKWTATLGDRLRDRWERYRDLDVPWWRESKDICEALERNGWRVPTDRLREVKPAPRHSHKGWSVDAQDVAAMREVATTHGARTVLEFGPGASTAAFLDLGLDVTSYEHDPAWLAKLRAELPAGAKLHGYANAERLSLPEIEGRAFDLALVDGPPGIPEAPPYNRFNAAAVCAAASPLVLVHDARRDRERALVAGYAARGWGVRAWDTHRGLALLTRPVRISYCTTCGNRLDDLKATLPVNLSLLGPGEELVLVVYADRSGTAEWVTAAFPRELAAGRLRLYTASADRFLRSHAKNVCHLLGRGSVLVNVDADNRLDPRYLYKLRRHDFRHAAVLYAGYGAGGHKGRVAITSALFRQMGGHNEQLRGYGQEEVDLIRRVWAVGVNTVPLWVDPATAIPTSDEVRAEANDPGLSAQDSDRLHAELTQADVDAGRLVANAGQPWGVADLVDHAGRARAAGCFP